MGQDIGAATSGRGLTGALVAAALRATAAEKLQRHRDEAVAGDGGEYAARDVKRTRSSIQCSALSVDPAAYHAQSTLTVPVGTTSVTVTEYAPDVFRFIRGAEGIAEELFCDEWNLPEERSTMALGEGRSQALFLKSVNMEFMCKTIAEDEVHVLQAILKDYTKHIVEEPDSLLMRFYMLLKVQEAKEVGYIVCFGDVFRSATALNEKWDIKGRVPKPGKFRHFPHLVRRAYEPDPYLIDTPRDDVDTDSTRTSREDVVVVNDKDKFSIRTNKDKDLTRLFWLPKERRDRLTSQLFSDYLFLGSMGLMDYSLLVGVSYNDNKVSRQGKRYMVIRNMKMMHELGKGVSEGVEERPGFPHRAGRGFESLSAFAQGISSLFDQEVYYIGVIDMLTAYSFKKKFANFCKSFLWEQNALSTIPPKEYQRRIMKYTTVIFPEVS